jgi:NDP-sugar pyrophosphorylase family protein
MGSSLVVTESRSLRSMGCADQGRQIHKSWKKPEMRVGNIINTGVYYLQSDIMRYFSEQTFDIERGITQTLAPMISRLDFTPVKTKGKWIDAGTPGTC